MPPKETANMPGKTASATIDSTNNKDPAPQAAKAQPWKAHWPPKKVDTSAPYGFAKGEQIVNSGN